MQMYVFPYRLGTRCGGLTTRPWGPIALSVSIALAVLCFKTVLLKPEVFEFNTQMRTKLNVIAV